MAQTITSSDGRAVPIKDICTVEHTENLQTVHRVNGRYTAEVTATVDSGNKYAISAKIDEAVKAIEFPEGAAPAQSTLDAQPSRWQSHIILYDTTYRSRTKKSGVEALFPV